MVAKCTCLIRIVKGQTFLIPILAMNRMKAIWGEDSHEFRCAHHLQVASRH